MSGISSGRSASSSARNVVDAVALKSYRYQSPPLSLLEYLYLNRFWDLVTPLYPRWLAPNLITLIGFGFLCSAFVALIVVSPHFDGKAPIWWLVMASACGFVYQTMDGTDGKQARRLKCGSALGEVIDHGCDAMTSTIYAVFCSEILGVGLNSIVGALFVLHAQLAFFFSNLTLLHFGRQEIRPLDCQEMQALIQVCGLVKAYSSKSLERQIPLPAFLARILESSSAFKRIVPMFPAGSITSTSWQFRGLFIVLGLLLPAHHALATGFTIIKHYCSKSPLRGNLTTPEKESIKEGSGIAGFFHQAALIIYWYIVSVVAYLVIRPFGTGQVVAWVMVSMLGFGGLMNRILVTRTAQMKLPRSPFEYCGGVGMLIIISVGMGQQRLLKSFYMTSLGCWGAVVCTFMLYLTYAVEVGNQMCAILEVAWFRVSQKKNGKVDLHKSS